MTTAKRAAPTRRAQELRQALLSAVWRQWAELGGAAAVPGKNHTRCIIDPEALILVTLWLANDEPRLIDVATSWGVLNSDFVSVQRIKNVARSYPEPVYERLRGFARIIAEAGAEARWKPLYAEATQTLAHRDNKMRAVRVDLTRPTATWLRLRGMFGLGIRPDVIVFLMRKDDPGEYIDSGAIAEAIGYSRPAVKRVLDALVEAGGLSVAPGRDAGYAIGWSSLFTILGPNPEQLPPWRYCHQTFALVTDFLSGTTTQTVDVRTSFIERVEVRRMIQRHGGYLVANRLFSPHEFPQIDEVEPFLHRIESMLDNDF